MKRQDWFVSVSVKKKKKSFQVFFLRFGARFIGPSSARPTSGSSFRALIYTLSEYTFFVYFVLFYNVICAYFGASN